VTVDRVAVWCGSVSVTEAQLRERVRQTAIEGQFPASRLVPIIDHDPVSVLVTALAVRSVGAIPLLGDERWSTEFWAQLRTLADRDTGYPDTGWAAFSSGSSGSPRVILRSEASWSSSFAALTELMQLESTDAVYLPAPLSSSLSLYSVAHARSVGAAIVLPKSHGFDPVDLEQASVVHGTPHALRTIVESMESGASPRRLRMALVGGAHLDTALRCRAVAQGMQVVSYYGAAELSFVAVDADGLGYRAFTGVDIRVDPGKVNPGTLWVRSPYLASGYLGGDGALQEAAGGWSSVGDLVEVDRAQRLHFRGRADRAILTASATVVPEDVESALRAIDGIEDAVVVGLANTGLGAILAVLIETAPGRAVRSLHDLRVDARGRLSLSHLPRRWYRTEQLPRTPAGKPARDVVRQAIENGEVARLE
jgi:long-chain acyl-CoA synthetase